MHTLITGGEGFIGSHLVDACVRRGDRVRALCQYNSFGSIGWLDDLPADVRDEVEVVAGDVRDPHSVRQVVKGMETVFHLAALIAIPYSYRSPDAYVDTNIRGTLNVLQAARDFGVHRLVHTSTSEVYGTAQFVPITELHPVRGQSPYSASKIGADHLALSYHTSFDLPVAIIRPFNTYGPRQSTRAVLPTVITQIAAGATVIRLGAVHPTRDFSFVEDTVRGFLAVAASDRAIGDVVNIGSNFEVSVGDAVALIAELMGVSVAIESDDARLRPSASEVERLWADTTRAREWCNWTPEFGGREGFRRGLKRTIEWFSSPANLARYRPGVYTT